MLLHQDSEAFLLEVAVVGQDFGYTLGFHDVHGYAVLEAVSLVEAVGVADEAVYEGVVGLLDDLYVRVGPNPPPHDATRGRYLIGVPETQ